MIRPGEGFYVGSVRPSPPMSNAERQRRFQEAHPGYDRRRKARQRAGAKRVVEALRQKLMMEAHAAEAQAEQAKAPAEAQAAKPVLMLPAPVQDPLMAQLNALTGSMAKRREAETVARVQASGG